MSDQDDLKKIYLEGINKVFSEKDPDAVQLAWKETFSESLHAESLGQTFDSAGFLSAMLGMKQTYVEIDMNIVQVLRTGRRIGTYEILKMKKANEQVDEARAIIQVEFGEIGSRDEKKVVTFREAIEFGPGD